MTPPWNGALHPRAAKGASNGGQFAAGSGSNKTSTTAAKKTTAKPKAVTVKTKGKLTFAEQAILRAGAAQGKVKLTASQRKQLHAAHLAHEAHLQHIAARPVPKKTATAKPKSKTTAKKTTTAKKATVKATPPNPVMARL
jgi:DNA-binding protein HU-beta